MPQQNKAALAVLSVGHFVNDTYASLLYPLLPLLATKLQLSPWQVFSLAPLFSITSSFMQPVYGFISDRYTRRSFAVMGPAITATFVSLIGLAPRFGLLAMCLILGGAGAGAFHPQAAAIAARSSRPFRRLGVSIFFSSGSLGLALGPLIIAGIVGATDLSNTYYIMVFGWIASLLLFRFCPPLERLPAAHASHTGRTRQLLDALRKARTPLLILYLITVARTGMQMLVGNYWPFLLKGRGYSVEGTGAVLTAFLLAAAFGSFLGGAFAERVGGRAMNLFSGLLAAPLLMAAPILSGPLSTVCLMVGGFVLMSTMSVNVVLAQEVAPRDTSTVSALMMGSAWGVGALAPVVAGPLTQLFSMRAVLVGAAAVPLFTAFFALRLPQDRIVRAPIVEELGVPVGG